MLWLLLKRLFGFGGGAGNDGNSAFDLEIEGPPERTWLAAAAVDAGPGAAAGITSSCGGAEERDRVEAEGDSDFCFPFLEDLGMTVPFSLITSTRAVVVLPLGLEEEGRDGEGTGSIAAQLFCLRGIISEAACCIYQELKE